MRPGEAAAAFSKDPAGGSRAPPSPEQDTLQPFLGGSANATSPQTGSLDVNLFSNSAAAKMLPADDELAASEGSSHRQRQPQCRSGIEGDSTSSSRNDAGNSVNSGSRSSSGGGDRGATARGPFVDMEGSSGEANVPIGRTLSDDGQPQNARPRSEDPPAMASLLSRHCLDDAVAVDTVEGGDSTDNVDDVRPGSPFLHRRNRLRGPPNATVMAPDAASRRAAGSRHSSKVDLLEAQEDPPMLSSRQRLLRPVSSDSIVFSIVSSNSSGDELDGQGSEAARARLHAGDGDDVSSLLPSTSALSGPASSNALLCPRTVYDADDNGSGTGKDGVDSGADSMHSSPVAVTLWGVDRDLRRKRIKKVSHYILGPLLGEGSYGVVRDCIDLNTDNADRRFSRCAIKIINGNYAKLDTSAAKPSKASSTLAAATEDGTDGGARAGTRGTLKRTSGIQYRREEDLKRQETFQREMRNLQRFHSKNIIRALDAFTRYSKEYVVMPIAICSLRQLVQQMLRTRWREAVREWRRAQRRLQRKQRHKRGHFATSVSGDQTQTPSQPSPWLPMVPSAVEELDMDELAFMTDGERDGGDDTDGISASQPHSSSDGDDGVAAERDSEASMVDHDEESQRQHSATSSVTATAVGGRVAAAAAAVSERGPSGQSRLPPRVAFNGASSTATTTHIIDRYTSHSNGSPPSQSPRQRSGEHFPTFAGGHHHGGGNGSWGDDVSDGSSASTTGAHNGITVMSATPPALSTAELPMECDDLVGSGANGADGRPPATVSPAPAPAASTQHIRPHMSLPVCSPTLLKGIFYQLMSGVAYLHQQHLAHNDIKPSNVLLFEDGTVKLADLGSVSDTYNDQGSPLCASPELCKYFYGAATPPASFSQSAQHVGRDAAQSSDMWCCGLMLYYLITGKPGPLPVQLRYFRALNSKQAHQPFRPFAPHGDSGRAALPPVVTRYQLYREIAQQTTPVDLGGLPDMVAPDVGNDVLLSSSPMLAKGEAPHGDSVDDAATSSYPPNGVRHLLAGLLELDPLRRLTAEQALRHPWLRMAFRSKTSETSSSNTISQTSAPNSNGGQQDDAQNQQQQLKAPSKQAMEEAIQRDVARRVMESRHVQHMLRLDRQRHLQFVADCCNMLNLAIPPEIIKVHPEAPYHEDNGASVCSSSPPALQVYRPNSMAAAAAAVSGRNTRLGRPSAGANAPGPRGSTGGSEWSVTSRNSHNSAVAGIVLRDDMRPRVMPPGCVDTDLFLPPSEEDYYEQKSGKAEFDVRVLRRKPLLMAQLDEYFHNVVLVQCGYRTGPDPNYQAMRLRAVPIEDESGGGGSGGSQGGTQQPAVMILPGACGNVCRRSTSLGLSSMPVAAALAGNSSDDGGTDGANSRGGSVDVWAAGPRHNPRTHVDDHREVVAAASSAGAVAGRGANLSRTSAAAGRSLIGTSPPGAAAPSRPSAAGGTGSRAPDAGSHPILYCGRGSTGGSGNGSASRRVAGRGRGRGQRDASESPSEEEANVAMRESSKCLCGLV
ncbi:protein_kinase_-_putative [Leishmania infantum]|uniref:Protein_kinase_-_putative n=2 Tax=Leishmania infantum TaxID=5671 RepID=A0A6L0WRH7_LEIIN|nr:protein_kinase_-_putative [Leishmania infantum]SUZ38729.1 protein_kinase_-_putative [Leishmania infantum]